MRKIVKLSTIICILLLTTLLSGCTGNKAPNAIIQIEQDSGCVPSIVYFTGSGTDTDGSIKSYLWNFGDGSTSNEQNPSHTFTNVGSYVVTLTVTDNGGVTGSVTKTISISKCNIPPTAWLSASPTVGPAALTVQFTGSGTDTDGYITSYYWNFGEGSNSNEQNPIHIFNNKGTYTVTLTVTDDDNAANTNSLTIIVQEVIIIPPTASASANPSTGPEPLTVQFTGLGTDSDGWIVSYQWDFGDSTTSTQQSPSHTYTTQGTYTATLTVTDNQGVTGTDSTTITVTLVVLPTNITYRTKVQLPVISDGSAVTWDGTYYYVADTSKGGIYQFDSSYAYTGTWFSYKAFTSELKGITYSNGYLYVVGGRFEWWVGYHREIYKLTTDGNLQKTWDVDSYITDYNNIKAVDSNSNHLYICVNSYPYDIVYFKISDMSYQGHIPNSHNPYGFAIGESSSWYFVTAYGGDVNRIYLCTMDGTNKWSQPFTQYNKGITIIDNTLLRINGNYLYLYDIV